MIQGSRFFSIAQIRADALIFRRFSKRQQENILSGLLMMISGANSFLENLLFHAGKVAQR